MPCFICHSRYRVDPCHIKTFGSSGIEEWWNMIPQCRAHHNEQHQIGWKRMSEKYPKLAALLKELGWEFLEPSPGQFKLFNPKERENA